MLPGLGRLLVYVLGAALVGVIVAVSLASIDEHRSAPTGWFDLKSQDYWFEITKTASR